MDPYTDQVLDGNYAGAQVKYAGFGPRFLAVIVDTVILLVVGYAVGLLVGFTGFSGGDYVGYLVGLAYNIGLHYRRGATLGKTALDIRVTDVGGGPLSLEQAFTREFFTYVYIACGIAAEALMPTSLRDGGTGVDPSRLLDDLLGPWLLVAGLGGLAVLVDILWMLGNERKRTLHDIIAKTYCVKA